MSQKQQAPRKPLSMNPAAVAKRERRAAQKAAKPTQAPSEATEEAQQQPQTTAVDIGSLRQRAMLVTLSVGRWYGTGADEEVIESVRKDAEAQGEVGTFTKRLMGREVLRAINGITNLARRVHKDMTLPWGDSGARLLSSTQFFAYKQQMTAMEVQFDAAVESFLAAYDEQVKVEEKRLGKLFKKDDYPTKEELRRRFRIRMRIEPIPSGADLRVDLGEQELERLQREVEQQVSESMRDATRSIATRLEEMVAKVHESMSKADPHVRSSMFDQLREFCALVPSLNVTSDPKIAEITKRVREELGRVDKVALQELRDDGARRKEVATKAASILDAMKLMTGAKGAK